MPRHQVYDSDAARQRACRVRKRRTTLAPDIICSEISPTCTLYCCDWHDVYALLPRKAAVITDPPYRTTYDYTKARRRPSQWDRNYVGTDQSFDPTPWLRFPEVILFGANHYRDRLPPEGSWWCWAKTLGQKSADFASCEWIWLSKPGTWKLFDQLSRGGMRAGEWNYTNLPQKRHPAEKPIELLLALVQETTAPLVIDPFMGSGTTLAACVRLGRPCIGVEIDPEYFAVACARLQQEVEALAS